MVVNQQSVSDQMNQMAAYDAQGKATTAQQQQLKQFIESHTGLSAQLFLQSSFERAEEAAKAAANPSSSGQLYAQAQAACGGKSDSVTQARCVQQYIAARGPANPNPQPVVAPSRADYTFEAKSPMIVADTVGLLLIAMVALALIGLVIYAT